MWCGTITMCIKLEAKPFQPWSTPSASKGLTAAHTNQAHVISFTLLFSQDRRSFMYGNRVSAVLTFAWAHMHNHSQKHGAKRDKRNKDNRSAAGKQCIALQFLSYDVLLPLCMHFLNTAACFSNMHNLQHTKKYHIPGGLDHHNLFNILCKWRIWQ